MKRSAIILLGLLLLVGGGYLAYNFFTDKDTAQNVTNQTASQENNDAAEETDTSATSTEAAPELTFAPPKKSAHYVSNLPEHAAILDEAPEEVSLTFNFDLSPKSTITVSKDGQEVSAGGVELTADKLSMHTHLVSGSASGLYSVRYNACWPDGSCHDGHFQFGVR